MNVANALTKTEAWHENRKSGIGGSEANIIMAGDAERLLDAMVDGLRVRMEITESGVTVYEFPEIRSAESFGHDG